MSQQEYKEGVVIDVSPDDHQATTEPEAKDQLTNPASSTSNRLPLIVAGISMLMVVGVLIAAFQYTEQAAKDLASINQRLTDAAQAQQQMQSELAKANAAMAEQAATIAKQQAMVEQQREALAEASQAFQEQEALLDRERLKMQQREVELRATVADVHQRVGSSSTEWLVAESEYLMRVANNRLALARDTDTARSALVLADQRLRDTRDPSWNPVRDQLARDITALDAAAQPDTAGISARLLALAEQVPQLQLAKNTLGGITPSQPVDASLTPREQRNWDTLLDDLWAGFKETVRIRRHDKPVAAMLAPEQQYFLYENLRLQLESARLAAAKADRELYRDSLGKVGSWLNTYFDNSDALTQTLRKGVNELARIDIRPPLPDISNSLNSLQVRRKLNADLAGSPGMRIRDAVQNKQRSPESSAQESSE